MKKVIFAIVVMLISFNSFSFDNKEHSIRVISRTHNIFYFKAAGNVIGGTVEIYNSTNVLVGTQNIINRKEIVDFFDMVPGTYKVRVVKDDIEEVYVFHKKDALITQAQKLFNNLFLRDKVKA